MKTTPLDFTDRTTPSAPRSSRLVPQIPLLAAATLALGVFVSNATAIDYYWHSTDGSSTWNTTSKWFTSPGGGGAAHIGGMSSANTYITNTSTNVLNTEFLNNTGTTNTFLGGTLVLAGGGQLNLRANGTGFAHVTDFVATGGGVIVSASGTGVVNNLIVDSFENRSGVTNLRPSSATNNRNMNLAIGTLFGSGDFAMDPTSQAGRTLFLSVTDATAYTGGFGFDRGVINFENNLVSGGSLTLSGTAVVTLDQSVTFSSVTISGTALAAGFHSFDSLNSAFDAFFTDGGTGGITVSAIPEPSSWTAFAGVAALLGSTAFRRRRA
jgi:MYXO-CTERM domain-containing protein